LRLAFFVAFELGGERGEIVKSAFLRGHPGRDCAPKNYWRQFPSWHLGGNRVVAQFEISLGATA
jgi:hypothetical protein